MNEITSPTARNMVVRLGQVVHFRGIRSFDYDTNLITGQATTDTMATSGYPIWGAEAGTWLTETVGVQSATWKAPEYIEDDTEQQVPILLTDNDLPEPGDDRNDPAMVVEYRNMTVVAPYVDFVSATPPNDSISFTTANGENGIVCVANLLAEYEPDIYDALYNGETRWTIQDDPNVTGDSGNPTNNEHGPSVTLHINNNVPSAPNGRISKLNYRIRAYLPLFGYNYYSNWRYIIQDDKDQLRQRYMDMNVSSVPARNILIDSTQWTTPTSPALSFSTVRCRGGSGNSWCTDTSKTQDSICKDATHGEYLTSITKTTSAKYALIEEDYTTGTIHISCVYRCPIHNKCVGGSATSNHMEGKAFDFDRNNGTIPSHLIYEIALCAYNRNMPAVYLYWSTSGASQYRVSFEDLYAHPGNYTGKTWYHGHVTTQN